QAAEAADPEADADRAAPAARGRGVLDGLRLEDGTVGLHDLRPLETAPPAVDLDAEPVGHDRVGGRDGGPRRLHRGLVREVGRGRRAGRERGGQQPHYYHRRDGDPHARYYRTRWERA